MSTKNKSQPKTNVNKNKFQPNTNVNQNKCQPKTINLTQLNPT